MGFLRLPVCVEHSHASVIVSDGSGPGDSKVMVPLSLSAIDVASSLRARLEPQAGQVRSGQVRLCQSQVYYSAKI